MVTDRDIVLRAVAEGGDMAGYTARQVMSPDVLYCFEDQFAEEVLRNMKENQVRRLPVVNRDKRWSVWFPWEIWLSIALRRRRAKR